MNKMKWVVVIVAVVFAGLGFWGGAVYGQSKTATTAATRLAAGSTFAGRGSFGGAGAGAAFGGGTVGTVVQIAGGTFTVQLPTSTSTSATTGTKLVLIGASTEINELESVPASNLQVGQTVTVVGTANSDGSITASSVMIRPATNRGSGANTGASQPQSGTQ